MYLFHKESNRVRRTTYGKLPSKFSPYSVSYFVSCKSIGASYHAFIAAVDAAEPIPQNWQEAKSHPRQREAMLEEMAALDKNNT
jgi:hypothetical protein